MKVQLHKRSMIYEAMKATISMQINQRKIENLVEHKE